jgi:putative transcriptional regulator
MERSYEELASRIAGQVVFSPNPGEALKHWRERLKIRQSELARAMGVAPSVLSDYESGRRTSPGVGFVKKYVLALVQLDREGGRQLERLVESGEHEAILAIGEFQEPLQAGELVDRVNGEVLAGEDRLETLIYGYTVVDSIKAIYALSGFDFYRIFGTTTERVIVFTKVGMGRSPLVAIRVSPLKPRMVILHGPRVVDQLAVGLAKRERIILVLSHLASERAVTEAVRAG